jgi:hypothetical protein
MRRLWVVVGGAVLLLDALILTGRILGPIDSLREASVHYRSQVIALGFGPLEAVLILGGVLVLSWAVVAGYRSPALPWLLRAGVFLGAIVTGAGIYTAVDPPTTGVSIGRGGSVIGGGVFASPGSLSTMARFATTLPAVGVAIVAGLATLIGFRALLQSRDTIIPVHPTESA